MSQEDAALTICHPSLVLGGGWNTVILAGSLRSCTFLIAVVSYTWFHVEIRNFKEERYFRAG